MTHLPPELAAFAAHFDAQPGPAQIAFPYGLARLLIGPVFVRSDFIYYVVV